MFPKASVAGSVVRWALVAVAVSGIVRGFSFFVLLAMTRFADRAPGSPTGRTFTVNWQVDPAWIETQSGWDVKKNWAASVPEIVGLVSRSEPPSFVIVKVFAVP